MMKIPIVLLLLSFLVVVIAAKKAHKENLAEEESWSHGAKKYSKEHQKPQHFNHKKHVPEEELANEAEPRAKQAPLEVPEPEVELQGHLETSKKSKSAVVEEEESQQKDLHLQDLAYEESLQKEKRHHKAEVDKKKKGGKAEKKLFADQEAKHSVDEKVIEDSFEPLDQEPAKQSPKDENKKHKKHNKEEKKNKNNKDKSKNKKAYEKGNKDGKKQKDGKKNKDKKYKKDKKH